MTAASGCYRLSQTCLLAGALSIAGCGNVEPEASIDQLVADMSRRIEVITKSGRQGDVIPRFNQSKTVACLNAEFRVHKDIPAELGRGLFAQQATYPATIRFANASEADDSKKDIRGMSIKVADVQGQTLWGENGFQDFLLNSYPALFVATPEAFLSFIKARQNDEMWRFFLSPFDPHLKSLWTVFRARKKHNSPLDIQYWSTVPFQLGDDATTAVKYAAIPCSTYRTGQAVDPGENQLRSAIGEHLDDQEACFYFAVQRRTDPQMMPIEDASVVWDETVSPFIPVATIIATDQAFDTPPAMSRCERISFNPWQSLQQHKPLGRMNEVRREVYTLAEKFRNGS